MHVRRNRLRPLLTTLTVYIDGCNNCIFTKNTMYELGYSCITGETTVPSPGTEFSTYSYALAAAIPDQLQRTMTATMHAK